MTERLNLVVFGATGFTGKYTVEELHRVAKEDKNITWGIAGRSQAKLQKIIKDLETKTGDDLKSIKLIIADVSDESSLTEMTKQANVIISCCGPYRFYGEPVVKACIETKTHYVDVSGEPAFMENMQLLYNEAAEKAGVYIVSACGFDSIPTDLGVSFLESKFKGRVNTAESYLNTTAGKKQFGECVIHYGTWESLIYGMANYKDLGPIRRQLFPEKLPQFLPKLKTRWAIHKSDIDGKWYLPFLGSDKPCVYRSQRFFYEQDKKRPVQMNAFVGFPSLFAAIVTILAMAIYWFMSQYKLGRKILLDYPKIVTLGLVSHEGPREEVMKNTKFNFVIKGEGWDESEEKTDGKPTTKTMKVKVSGVNPGYGATCTALVYAAYTILKEENKMPKTGGVLAPAAAFSKTSIIEKLNAHDLTFEVIE